MKAASYMVLTAADSSSAERGCAYFSTRVLTRRRGLAASCCGIENYCHAVLTGESLVLSATAAAAHRGPSRLARVIVS